MKNCVLKLKQCFCLMLSIVLLSANVQVFAQSIPKLADEVNITELEKEFGEISSNVKKFKTKIEKIYKNMDAEIAKATTLQEINEIYTKYFADIEVYKIGMKKVFNEYEDFLTKFYYAEMHVSHESAKYICERLSYEYTGAPIAYPNLMSIYENKRLNTYRRHIQELTP
ncbi:MAG: hypothetical protein K6E94_02285 [Elusimicrobiaceae bacterium]|nr:hypothetical protein [Elusimicrobiaceae bacterium]